MSDRSSPASLAGLLAVGLGVCCGLPVLASLGVLGAIAGYSRYQRNAMLGERRSNVNQACARSAIVGG